MVNSLNLFKKSVHIYTALFLFFGSNAFGASLPEAKNEVELKFSKPKISGNLFCVPISQIQQLFKNTVKTEISHIDLSESDLSKFIDQVNLNPDDIDSRITLGLIYGNKEKYLKALEEFKFVLKKKPDHQLALYSIGLIYLFQENHLEALKYFSKVVELDNTNAYAHYNKGMIEYARFEKEDALKSLKKAIELDNHLIEAHYNLGVIYGSEAHGIALQGHVGGGYDEREYQDYLKKAVKEFKAALRVKPDHFGALYNMGLSYLFLEKFDEAFIAADYLEEINPFLGQQLRFRVENPVASH